MIKINLLNILLFAIVLFFIFSIFFDIPIQFRDSENLNLQVFTPNEQVSDINPIASGAGVSYFVKYFILFANNLIVFFFLIVLYLSYFLITYFWIYFPIFIILYIIFSKMLGEKHSIVKKDFIKLFIKGETAEPIDKKPKENKELENILSKIDFDDQSNIKLSILNLNHLLSDLLEKNNFLGETVAERAKSILDEELRNNILYVNRMRNKIAHNQLNVKLSREESSKIIKTYEKIFSKLN